MSQTEAEKRAEERKKRLKKYFTEPPDPRDFALAWVLLAVAALTAVGAGAIDVVVGAPFLAKVVLVAALIVAAAGVDRLLLYRRQFATSHPRPSDKEMDRLLAAELVRIGEDALRKLAITSDDLELTGQDWDPVAQLEHGNPVRHPHARRPLVVFGPDDEAHAEIGSDAVWRFSAYRVMVICPTHFNLGIYQCLLDALSGVLAHEQTREYHYDDIVAISTVSVGVQEPARLRLKNEEFHFARMILRELQIVASSSDRATVPVVVPGYGDSGQTKMQWSGIEEVIAAVRRVLRDRKGAGRLEQV
jgi:hypothetical protein